MTSDAISINSKDIDYQTLIGREVSLITEQFPGKSLVTRVTAIGNGNLIVDRSGGDGLVNQLINRQNAEIHFIYKGEPVYFTSTILAPRDGVIQIPISQSVRAKVRRRFVRFGISKDIKLTYFSSTNIKTARLNKLKWFGTRTINISGGGSLIEMPIFLDSENYIIMNLGLSDTDMPNLLLGQVRHCLHGNKMANIGVEFIINETGNRMLPNSLIRNLPQGILLFNKEIRSELACYLEKKYS